MYERRCYQKPDDQECQIIQDCQQANENNNGMLRFTDVGTDTQVTMKNCKILRNRACHGVLRTASKNVVTMTISDSEFQHNHSTGGWGVVLWNSQEGSCNISNTIFNHNRSENRGGAISSEAKDLTLTGCTFTNNSAGEYGGAIAVFSYQSANNPDGADYNINVTIDSGCVFEGNTAPKGGAIAFDITKSAYADEGDKTRFKLKVDIQAGTGWFTNNTATQYGGAVWIKRDDENSTGVLNVKSGTISDNSASSSLLQIDSPIYSNLS